MNNTKTIELTGREFAGCEIIREIGCGSNATVYLANQKRLNRQVACKIFTAENPDDQPLADAVFAEERSAIRIDHPNVVQYINSGSSSDGLNFVIMEFVSGSTLETIRTEHPELISTKFLLNLAIQLADALDTAWQKHNIIHGDIKPANMLIRTLDHQLKLCNLGVVRNADDLMITPLYAAPEVIRQQSTSPDVRSDIYSFGAVMYELSCGTAPFQGSMEEIIAGHLDKTPVPPQQLNSELDPETAELLTQMLAKFPDDRPASWQEIRDRFSAIRDRLYPSGVPVLEVACATTVSIDADKTVSWGDGLEKKPGFLEKNPRLLPTILIGIIMIAIVAIIIQLI